MDIKDSFEVERPLAAVWELFTDVPTVAQCLPGAELTADHGDGTYDGKLSIKLGPIAASFDGTAKVIPNEAEHSMVIEGKGVDRSGGSQGRVNVDVTLVATDPSTTEVTIDSKVTLAGPIAQFGRTGLVAEVSKRLMGEFADCLHKKLAAATPTEASEVKAADVKGLSLFFASLWAWIKGIFRK